MKKLTISLLLALGLITVSGTASADATDTSDNTQAFTTTAVDYPDQH